MNIATTHAGDHFLILDRDKADTVRTSKRMFGPAHGLPFSTTFPLRHPVAWALLESWHATPAADLADALASDGDLWLAGRVPEPAMAAVRTAIGFLALSSTHGWHLFPLRVAQLLPVEEVAAVLHEAASRRFSLLALSRLGSAFGVNLHACEEEAAGHARVRAAAAAYQEAAAALPAGPAPLALHDHEGLGHAILGFGVIGDGLHASGILAAAAGAVSATLPACSSLLRAIRQAHELRADLFTHVHQAILLERGLPWSAQHRERLRRAAAAALDTEAGLSPPGPDDGSDLPARATALDRRLRACMLLPLRRRAGAGVNSTSDSPCTMSS